MKIGMTDERRPTEQQLDLYDLLDFCLHKKDYSLVERNLEISKDRIPKERYEFYKIKLEEGLKREEEKDK